MYARLQDYVAELFMFVTDSFAYSEPPKYSDKLFDDTHAHFRIPQSKQKLKAVLDILVKRLDRCSITYCRKHNEELTYERLVEMLRDFTSVEKEYNISQNGLVAKLTKRDKEIEFYKSQEVDTEQGFHIIAEGCNEYIPDGLDGRAAVERIHELNGIAIIAHPFTMQTRLFGYRFINDEERKFLEEELYPMVHAVEGHNAMNTFYMSFSNAMAKTSAKNYDIPSTAGTDKHPGKSLREELLPIGRAGIYLPKLDTRSLTDREIFEWKRDLLKKKTFETHEHYVDGLTFLKIVL